MNQAVMEPELRTCVPGGGCSAPLLTVANDRHKSLSADGPPPAASCWLGMMTCMVQDAGRPPPETPAVTRLGEEDWRIWCDVRLAALADTPASFAATLGEEQAIQEDGWRTMVRDAAIFVVTVGGTAVGAVAGLYRASAQERGLGAMWVAPKWRGRGVAARAETDSSSRN
jgi:Acetyltransferase (GNAT) family